MNFDLLGKHHSVPCASDCTNDDCTCVCHKTGSKIKYPVRVEKVSGKNENFLFDADGKSIGVIYDILPAFEIANALNAMHEPRVLYVLYYVDDEYGRRSFYNAFNSVSDAQLWFDTSEEGKRWKSYGYPLYLSPEEFEKENGSCGPVLEMITVK
jgi:hypothetical protein